MHSAGEGFAHNHLCFLRIHANSTRFTSLRALPAGVYEAAAYPILDRTFLVDGLLFNLLYNGFYIY